MGTNRLEAFSDGVIAILIIIMVLDLRARVRDQRQSSSLKPPLLQRSIES